MPLVVRSRVAAALIAGLALAPLAASVACSHTTSTVEATSTEYNGTYAGPGTLTVRDGNLPVMQGGGGDSATVLLTLSQMGSTLSGTLTTEQGSYSRNGGVMGSTTGTGGAFSYVEAGYSSTSCPATLHGTFTINNGLLTGSATGRDCYAAGSDNVTITFSNLAKQP